MPNQDSEDSQDNLPKTRFFDSIKDWIAIAVSVFGIIAFVRTCAHENEIKNLNYDLLSLGHQPRLKLAGSPRISRISIDTLSVKLREHPDQHSGELKDPHVLDIKFELTIESKLKITNTSENSLGKILVFMSTDSIPKVKDFITGKLLPDSVDYDFHHWPKLENSHVLPGDTLEMSITTKVRHISDRTYITHFILVYQNELGNLYHTHSLLAYKQKPWMSQTKVEMKVKELERLLYTRIKEMITKNEFMKPLAPVSYYETYNRNDTELAKKHLKKLMPDIGL